MRFLFLDAGREEIKEFMSGLWGWRGKSGIKKSVNGKDKAVVLDPGWWW